MIIKVDADGKGAIEQLVDIALKQGGIQNLNAANVILRSVRLLPTLVDTEQGTDLPENSEEKTEAESEAAAEKQEEKPKEEVPEEEEPKEGPEGAGIDEVKEDKVVEEE